MAIPITSLAPSLAATEASFASFGDQLRAIANAAITETGSGVIDQRLVDLNRRAALGASETVPSAGGFLVAPEFSREIMKRMYLVGDIMAKCLILPITNPHSNAIRFPQFMETSRANGSRLGGVQAYYQNEADSIPPSKPGFMASTLTAHKIVGLIECTDELMADSGALGSWMTYALAQELTFKLEYGIVNGTGAGQPQGLLNSPALVSVPAEGGQASATVVSANIQKMMASFWSASYNSPAACWLYNQALLPQLATLQTVVGTAGSESQLWHWAEEPDQYDMLAGFPAMQSEYCQVPGTPGDIILCDLSRYVLAMREAIRNELSIHLLFLTDQSAFRAVMRVNGQTIDTSPITPLFGTRATSPFVALAAR